MPLAKNELFPLSQDELKQLISYDPETGIVRWLVGGGKRKRKRGSIVGAGGAGDWYHRIRIGKHVFQLHRVIWFYVTGEWPDYVDHKDNVKTNNQWDNLRNATNQQNAVNCGPRKDNKLGVKGVSRHPSGFASYITIRGRNNYLGLFATVEEASAAYLARARQEFGEFARGSW